MTTFDDRERGFENKFAHDQEMAFRITARRNRLVGEWAAKLMSLTPAETDSYAKTVVQADFEEAGDDDIVRKLLGASWQPTRIKPTWASRLTCSWPFRF